METQKKIIRLEIYRIRGNGALVSLNQAKIGLKNCQVIIKLVVKFDCIKTWSSKSILLNTI